MTLTDTEKQALRSGEAVRVRDDDVEYVLVRADVFDRAQHLLFDDRDWTQAELRHLLAKSAEANGWNEPGMEAYDQYDEEIKKRCP
jgi:hypothetical protein